MYIRSILYQGFKLGFVPIFHFAHFFHFPALRAHSPAPRFCNIRDKTLIPLFCVFFLAFCFLFSKFIHREF